MDLYSSAELFPPVKIKTALTLALLSIAYVALSSVLLGFKTDQLVLIGLVNGLYYLSGYTRRFVTGFGIFIVYWIIFDYMKLFPNYHFNTVHIGDLYNTEKSLFGIHTSGSILTPNEYLKANSRTWLDVVTGLFYLCWIPVPLGFAAYLLFTWPKEFLGFALTFFLVNLLGFVVYYTFPAAPPWFIQEHGFHFIPLTKASTAGLARFDNYFHAGIFKLIYSKGSNVFAAYALTALFIPCNCVILRYQKPVKICQYHFCHCNGWYLVYGRIRQSPLCARRFGRYYYSYMRYQSV
jgi:hypothetical protein